MQHWLSLLFCFLANVRTPNHKRSKLLLACCVERWRIRKNKPWPLGITAYFAVEQCVLLFAVVGWVRSCKCSVCATKLRYRILVKRMSRSTAPSIPATVALLVYCQSAKSNFGVGLSTPYSASQRGSAFKASRSMRARSWVLP